MKFTPKGHPLKDVLAALGAQGELLAMKMYEHLAKEAQRKHVEATLISTAPGRSHAERVTQAQSSQEWLDFHTQLAKVEARHEFERLKYTLLEREYQAQYLTLKQDEGLIRKQE